MLLTKNWCMHVSCVQTVKTAQELRKPVYCGVAAKALPYDQVGLKFSMACTQTSTMYHTNFLWQLCIAPISSVMICFFFLKHCHSSFFFTLQVLQGMASVKWDIRDIMSQHSAYVDLLVQVRCIDLQHELQDNFESAVQLVQVVQIMCAPPPVIG